MISHARRRNVHPTVTRRRAERNRKCVQPAAHIAGPVSVCFDDGGLAAFAGSGGRIRSRRGVGGVAGVLCSRALARGTRNRLSASTTIKRQLTALGHRDSGDAQKRKDNLHVITALPKDRECVHEYRAADITSRDWMHAIPSRTICCFSSADLLCSEQLSRLSLHALAWQPP